MKSYTGVTGFMTGYEAVSALKAFPASSNRRFMMGVLASWKSLRNAPMNALRRKRSPDPKVLGSIFQNDPRALNLVHYNSEAGQEYTLVEDLTKIRRLAGEHLHGFQLNMVWPNVSAIAEYRATVDRKSVFILQIGGKALEVVDRDPKKLADKVARYEGLIDGILIDPSGGLGKEFDTVLAKQLLAAIGNPEKGIPSLGLGVAGGIGPLNFGHVKPIIEDFPNVSIDAEGKLRNADNKLDLGLVALYLAEANALFAN